ncbi:MAG: FAD-dependent tricarballylate dehydrogenase TcuA [Prochloraceae cyanobacterium]|nr:FAD-dependent tricarballylate dehydrogenase TcuA [Prochloraceae cyanobacterium]
MKNNLKYDVVILGAGNAALCAALAAREQGAKVLLLERAPASFRGGNSYFTDGAIRFAYKNLDDIRKIIPELTDEQAAKVDVGSYTEEEYFEDLMRVTKGKANRDLAQRLVNQSYPTIQWLYNQGVRFSLLYQNQAFKSNDRYHFWGSLVVKSVGKGIGLIDTLFERAEQMGVEIWYEARGKALIKNSQGKITAIEVQRGEDTVKVEAEAIVLASGGFEANPEMRVSNLGSEWKDALVRGTQYNTGDGIRMAVEVGAVSYGDWEGCHSIATDLNAPVVGDFSKPGDIFKKHCYPLGIMVNKNGDRFVDEGADFRNYTYAKYGRAILNQPDNIAYQIFDNKVAKLLREEYELEEATRLEARTLEALAARIDIDKQRFLETVRSYNEAVLEGDYNPHIKDQKGTVGINPPKSNWALKIDTPPFLAFPVTCGITFTFGGLKVTTNSQVLDTNDRVIPGLYAAGELVGGLFYHNYPGGSGLMSGATFGKIAGTHAATERIIFK